MPASWWKGTNAAAQAFELKNMIVVQLPARSHIDFRVKDGDLMARVL